MKNLNQTTIQILITFAKDLFRRFLLKDEKSIKYFQPVVRQILILLALSLYSNLHATTCTTTAPGVWDCGTPTGSDDLIVNHDVTISGDFTLTGSIIVNAGATLTFTGEFILKGSSTTSISGTLDVTGNMQILGNAIVTVTGTGILNARSDLETGPGFAKLIVDSGGVVNVIGDFTIDNGLGTVTINGTLDVGGAFQNDNSLCGTGIITYDTCSGSGDACGDSGWCDGSGTLNLGALPIELHTFEVKLEDNNVRIEWVTASEIDNDYFVVERSRDAHHFEEIELIEGAGNSDAIRYYAVTDRFPFEGISYYRLKQVDFDGTTTYFDIKIVDNNDGYTDTHGLTVFPNPIMEHSTFSIGLEGFDGGTVKVEILNMSGFVIYSDQINISQERELIELETNIIHNTGMYVVSVFNDNKWYHHKFMYVK